MTKKQLAKYIPEPPLSYEGRENKYTLLGWIFNRTVFGQLGGSGKDDMSDLTREDFYNPST